jgi:hypothetical protein
MIFHLAVVLHVFFDFGFSCNVGVRDDGLPETGCAGVLFESYENDTINPGILESTQSVLVKPTDASITVGFGSKIVEELTPQVEQRIAKITDFSGATSELTMNNKLLQRI